MSENERIADALQRHYGYATPAAVGAIAALLRAEPVEHPSVGFAAGEPNPTDADLRDEFEQAAWDASVEQIHRELAGEVPPLIPRATITEQAAEEDWTARVDKMLAASDVPNPVGTAFVLGREYDAAENPMAIGAQLERLEAMVFPTEPAAPTGDVEGLVKGLENYAASDAFCDGAFFARCAAALRIWITSPVGGEEGKT